MHAADVKITHVPYRGAAPAVTDLIAGNISLMITGVPPQLGQIKAGRVRPIAVATAKRLPMFPDVPTIGETVKGYEASALFGMGAPAKAPKEIISKLNAGINAVMSDPAVKKQLVELGGEPRIQTPEAFGVEIAAETEKWKKVVEFAGLKVE